MNITTMQQELQQLQASGNLRHLPSLVHRGKWVESGGQVALNLSSNDYLGLATDEQLRTTFMQSLTTESFLPTSSSSRLLTGNFSIYDELETELAQRFGTEAALVFNCGYHANTGILPAVTDANSLILADKLIHASLIDGIRLCAAKCVRYRHNDLNQLARLVEKYASQYEQIVVVTESIFSMDGDRTDLTALVALKRQYPQVMLYIDEAHGFGVFGPQGLGCAEEEQCIGDIDFLVGTFGKAGASSGAYIVCKEVVRNYLINKMRPFIFTTALPPLNVAWTLFVLRRLPLLQARRHHVLQLSEQLRQALQAKGYRSNSASQIVPLVIGASADAIQTAELLQRKGFYVLPVRPPTVPEGTSRLRFSLTAALTREDMDRLIATIDEHLPTISPIEP